MNRLEDTTTGDTLCALDAPIVLDNYIYIYIYIYTHTYTYMYYTNYY